MAYSQNPFSVASFGESYEQADASFAITGVQGTGVIDSGIAVAILTVVDLATTSVQATAATNTVTVVAKAVVVPTGVSATGTADDGLTFITGTGATPTIDITLVESANIFSLFKSESLSANQTKELLTQPLVIQAGEILKAQASAANQLHLIVSYLEIT